MGLIPDRLIELLVQFLYLFKFWEVVDEYESALVLQLGRFRRTIGPGIWLKCPFGIDEVLRDNVTVKTHVTSSQTLCSKDGVEGVFSAVLTYRIRDFKKFQFKGESAYEVLQDSTVGIIGDMVLDTNWEDIRKREWREEVFTEVRKNAWPYGLEVIRLKFANLGRFRTIRLLNSTDE